MPGHGVIAIKVFLIGLNIIIEMNNIERVLDNLSFHETLLLDVMAVMLHTFY